MTSRASLVNSQSFSNKALISTLPASQTLFCPVMPKAEFIMTLTAACFSSSLISCSNNRKAGPSVRGMPIWLYHQLGHINSCLNQKFIAWWIVLVSRDI